MFVTIGGLRGSLSLVLAETVATMVTEDDSLVVTVRGGVREGGLNPGAGRGSGHHGDGR